MLRRLVQYLTASRRLRQRGLFSFWDGSRQRYADPFKVWREIASNPDLNLEEMAEDIDKGEEPATSIAIKAVCQAFGVERWSDESHRGLTDWELLNLLGDFQGYLELLKKSGSLGPTSSPAMDSESSTSPAGQDAATSFSSAFGYASSEPSSASPTAPSAASAPE